MPRAISSRPQANPGVTEMSPHASRVAGAVTIGAMVTEAPCDCCGRPVPSGWLHSEPPSDLFPRGRMLCGTCFNHHLFIGHRPLRRQP